MEEMSERDDTASASTRDTRALQEEALALALGSMSDLSSSMGGRYPPYSPQNFPRSVRQVSSGAMSRDESLRSTDFQASSQSLGHAYSSARGLPLGDVDFRAGADNYDNHDYGHAGHFHDETNDDGGGSGGGNVAENPRERYRIQQDNQRRIERERQAQLHDDDDDDRGGATRSPKGKTKKKKKKQKKDKSKTTGNSADDDHDEEMEIKYRGLQERPTSAAGAESVQPPWRPPSWSPMETEWLKKSEDRSPSASMIQLQRSSNAAAPNLSRNGSSFSNGMAQHRARLQREGPGAYIVEGTRMASRRRISKGTLTPMGTTESVTSSSIDQNEDASHGLGSSRGHGSEPDRVIPEMNPLERQMTSSCQDTEVDSLAPFPTETPTAEVSIALNSNDTATSPYDSRSGHNDGNSSNGDGGRDQDGDRVDKRADRRIFCLVVIAVAVLVGGGVACVFLFVVNGNNDNGVGNGAGSGPGGSTGTSVPTPVLSDSPSMTPTSSPTFSSWLPVGATINTSAIIGSSSANTFQLARDSMCLVASNPQASNGRGAVRVFSLTGNGNNNEQWMPVGDELLGDSSGDNFGKDLAVSDDCTRIVACAGGSNYTRAYELYNGVWTTMGSTDLASTTAGLCLVSLTGDGSRLAITIDTTTTSGERLPVSIRVLDFIPLLSDPSPSAGSWEPTNNDFAGRESPNALSLHTAGTAAAHGYILRGDPNLESHIADRSVWRKDQELPFVGFPILNDPVTSFSDDLSAGALSGILDVNSNGAYFFITPFIRDRAVAGNKWQAVRLSSSVQGIYPYTDWIPLCISGDGASLGYAEWNPEQDLLQIQVGNLLELSFQSSLVDEIPVATNRVGRIALNPNATIVAYSTNDYIKVFRLLT